MGSCRPQVGPTLAHKLCYQRTHALRDMQHSTFQQMRTLFEATLSNLHPPRLFFTIVPIPGKQNETVCIVPYLNTNQKLADNTCDKRNGLSISVKNFSWNDKQRHSTLERIYKQIEPQSLPRIIMKYWFVWNGFGSWKRRTEFVM